MQQTRRGPRRQRASEVLDPILVDERCELDGNVSRDVEELQPDLVLPESMPPGPPDHGLDANTAVLVEQCYLMPSSELAPTEQPDTARREIEYAAQVALQLLDVDADGTPTFRTGVRAVGRPLDRPGIIRRPVSIHHRPFVAPAPMAYRLDHYTSCSVDHLSTHTRSLELASADLRQVTEVITEDVRILHRYVVLIYKLRRTLWYRRRF